MSDNHYNFNVKMSCSGCSGAIDRVLKKLPGVKDIDISLEQQSVDVKTEPNVQYQTVYDTIHKTGKEIVSGQTVN